jgi:hypothetical protein
MSAYWKARAAKGARDRNRIAEFVANGMSIVEAGREVGVGPAAAYKQWGLIKAGLGWQAQ